MSKRLQQQNTQRTKPLLLSLQRTAATLGRLSLTGAVSFGIGVLSMVEHHNTYWNTTIFRVQTVDFNILSHTLPTKLSYTILQNQPEELQRTLDSNYNLFGLVVTDASGKNIIAYSGKGSKRESSWISALEPERLQKYPYDVLLDPPPLLTQWNYSDTHAQERSAIGSITWGRFIGRVYYVRGVPPTFADDFRKWLSNPFTGSSRFQLYNLTMVACFSGGAALFYFWEYLLYKRRVQIREAKSRENFLVAQNQTVTLQLNERISQAERLQQQLEQERLDAKSYAEEIHHRNQQLQQEIFQLEGTINSLPTAAVLQTKEAELKKASQEAELAKHSQEHLKSEIQHLNQILQDYQDKFRDAQQQKAEQDQLQHKILETKEACLQAELELKQYAFSEQNLRETIAKLEPKIVSEQELKEKYAKQLEVLQYSLTESQERENKIKEKAERTEQERLDAKSYAEEIHHRNQQLQQEIFQLQISINSLPTAAVLQTKEVELKKTDREAELAKQSQENLKADIQQLNQILQDYQDKFRDAQQQKAEQDQLQRKILETEEACLQAELELEQYSFSEQNLQETLANLELQIVSQQELQKHYAKQLELLQCSLAESQESENKFKEKAKRKEQQRKALSLELELLKEEIPRENLNEFEKDVLKYLKLKFKEQKIFSNYDTSFGHANSKIADFIIVFQNCIIVIEAKGHQGNIEAIGDIRNTEWICSNGNQQHIINSCWGSNPYLQVKTYIDSLMSKINWFRNNPKNKLPIYGIVVFPSEAKISQEISSNIGGYSQVTTLENLEEVIKLIENKARSKNKSGLSYKQIVKLLEAPINNYSSHRNVA